MLHGLEFIDMKKLFNNHFNKICNKFDIEAIAKIYKREFEIKDENL